MVECSRCGQKVLTIYYTRHTRKCQMVQCICPRGHPNTPKGRSDRKYCLEKKFEEEKEKFKIADIEILFPYGLWLTKEVEKLKKRRELLEDEGGQVIKCDKNDCATCDDLIEGRGLLYNEGNRSLSLTRSLSRLPVSCGQI